MIHVLRLRDDRIIEQEARLPLGSFRDKTSQQEGSSPSVMPLQFP